VSEKQKKALNFSAPHSFFAKLFFSDFLFFFFWVIFFFFVKKKNSPLPPSPKEKTPEKENVPYLTVNNMLSPIRLTAHSQSQLFTRKN